MRFLTANVLLLAGIGLWVTGVLRTDTSRLGPYGLLSVLPVVYYVGIALVVASAAIELARHEIVVWKTALHAVSLVVMLYSTAPLVYPEGRYSWLYKTVGVVQYVNAHGALNSHIDIYQNWPGFFALTAWLDKAAGVASPLAYAKWAQLTFELAALPLLVVIYQALSLTRRQQWFAILLYYASNWIGQDYLSPQALGVLLSLGVMALCMRWLIDPSRRARRLAAPPGEPPDDTPAEPPDDTPAEPPDDTPAEISGISKWLLYALIVIVFFVLTFTHQLSPYMLVIQFAALAVTGRLRPRWLPAVLAAITLGYLAPRFGFVNQHFGLLNALGRFFTNLTPPSRTFADPAFSQLVIQRCAQLLSVGMWMTALIGCWRRRQSGEPVLHLALLAFSPIILLAMQDYGHEGVLRVYLFSLPWSTALVASAIAPAKARNVASRATTRLAGLRHALAGLHRRLAGLLARLPGQNPALTLRLGLALSIALALFYPSFYGDDAMNVMSRSEVTTISAFLRTAKPGPIYCVFTRAPLADTARYNLFPLAEIFGATGVLGPASTRPLPPHPARTLHLARSLASDVLANVGLNGHAYVMISPSMVAYNAMYHVVDPKMITILVHSLERSVYWHQILSKSGTLIYEVQPAYPGNSTSLGRRNG